LLVQGDQVRLEDARGAVRDVNWREQNNDLGPLPHEIRYILFGFFMNLECVDNVRIARTTNLASIGRYEVAKINGCCGYADREVYVNGELWKVGCNYGH